MAEGLGPVELRQAEHTLGTGVSNVAQGRDWTEGQGLGERLKGEAIGAVTAPIDARLKARKAEAAGLETVMDRCVKIEHARLFGGLNWAGVNTKVVSAKRPKYIAN